MIGCARHEAQGNINTTSMHLTHHESPTRARTYIYFKLQNLGVIVYHVVFEIYPQAPFIRLSVSRSRIECTPIAAPGLKLKMFD
mmetsp:Transcript_29861/g.91658  ORF Transcript_29861/g.91658 Transcript_29861/m.91658 type:complete len:84 (+) Transcript_29861:97-348(+)|eukprot:scaffold292529_cov31-Tisochrysis_lutea.AAC.8